MRESKGFTLVELMTAMFIFLVVIGVFFLVYQAGTTTFQESKRKMEAVDKLWLNMGKIKKEVREGKEFNPPNGFPADSLVFATNDTTTIVFYTPEGSDNIYKEISGSTSPETFALGVSISSEDPGTAPSTQVELSAEWSYKQKTQEESISSVIYLRNWER